MYKTATRCLFLAALTAVFVTGCGAPAEQEHAVNPAGGQTQEAVIASADPAVAQLSKRVGVLREKIESELANAYQMQNPADVTFDTLAEVQNSAFDSIDLLDSEGAECSYSMSTLSDHIYVYLSCDEDTHEFEWRP
jgi:hypothetical protein